MNTLDQNLIALGAFIDNTRRQMHISVDLLCAEVACSKTTYTSVWRGQTKNIVSYHRVLFYLRAQANEPLQRQIDDAILQFFTTPPGSKW